ncbi:hypothetical protein Fot_15117 [Forsythia ovata]|uniref:Uncharacterized protein n=1 Tax=Forsythia ovata TaxID=205694 RepID=A0ABD1W8B9_9LAMI
MIRSGRGSQFLPATTHMAVENMVIMVVFVVGLCWVLRTPPIAIGSSSGPKGEILAVMHVGSWGIAKLIARRLVDAKGCYWRVSRKRSIMRSLSLICSQKGICQRND